jgi:hypothetical protein
LRLAQRGLVHVHLNFPLIFRPQDHIVKSGPFGRVDLFKNAN